MTATTKEQRDSLLRAINDPECWMVDMAPGDIRHLLADSERLAAIEAVTGESDASVGWIMGAPPYPWCEEWFIAELISGDRVVLTALPKEYTYDFKTADETYLASLTIKRWMQFQDSEYVHPSEIKVAERDEEIERLKVQHEEFADIHERECRKLMDRAEDAEAKCRELEAEVIHQIHFGDEVANGVASQRDAAIAERDTLRRLLTETAVPALEACRSELFTLAAESHKIAGKLRSVIAADHAIALIRDFQQKNINNG